jgi:hypothetical protein
MWAAMADSSTKKPTHTAYAVRNFQRDGEDDSSWSRIGVAFHHRDGKGMDIVLDAVPVNGRVVLRLNEPKSKKAD